MIKILKNFKSKEWLIFGISVCFVMLQVWLDLKLPDYMSKITMLVQTPGSQMSEILSAGGWMLLCALGSLLSSITVAGLAAKMASNLSSRLRGQLFDKVQSFSMKEINNFSTDSLITRSTNDITQIQMFVVMGLQMLIKAPIMAIWAICKISGKSWQWSAATGGAVLVLVVVVGVCMVLAIPRMRKLQSLTDNINRVTRENLTGIRVVRAYNAENYEETKFAKANKELTNTSIFTNSTMSIMMPSVTLILNGLSLAIYWIGAVLINNAALPDKMGLFSDMIVFSSYAVQVVMAFMILIMVFILMPRAAVAAKRVNEVLETPLSLEDGQLEKAPQDVKGEVEFKNVSFKYPDANDYVLKDISFKVKKGETIAFIGATGCGKSTLVNLVPRFYDATEGEVLVDGVNVREYKQNALRNLLGYVSQKATLFEGDITSNIVFGDHGKGEISTSEVVEAAYIAQASEFIEKTEGEYKAYVAQGGSNLSGGQKQRLSIARAIARHPEILIFDDSFSALDYKTDRKLRSILKKETAGTTMMIVAQRIGTIKEADQIIVLDEGKMVGKGTHDELMKNCEVYREIAYSQLSKEELA
ncbi:MAG: ABC transporter ATP-binding protein [Cellulosilyticum sp.]|nr:ABC transporter ATP-binding protein [Cellulosilyticum sp.]